MNDDIRAQAVALASRLLEHLLEAFMVLAASPRPLGETLAEFAKRLDDAVADAEHEKNGHLDN